MIKRMHAEVSSILAQEDIRTRFATLGAEPGNLSQEEFANYVNSEIDKWAKVIQEAGVSVD